MPDPFALLYLAMAVAVRPAGGVPEVCDVRRRGHPGVFDCPRGYRLGLPRSGQVVGG